MFRCVMPCRGSDMTIELYFLCDFLISHDALLGSAFGHFFGPGVCREQFVEISLLFLVL